MSESKVGFEASVIVTACNIRVTTKKGWPQKKNTPLGLETTQVRRIYLGGQGKSGISFLVMFLSLILVTDAIF